MEYINIEIDSDKSIAQRALIMSLFVSDNYQITNLKLSGDINSTLQAVKKLGVTFENNTIVPPKQYNQSQVLNLGNSGTGARLLLGALSACQIEAIITGDNSLMNRPMERVIKPLTLMGGIFEGINLPIKVLKANNLPYQGELPIDSAQVKSAMLFKAIKSVSPSKIEYSNQTRNHTELMLTYLGANIIDVNNKITIFPTQLEAKDIYIPGDISNVYNFICASILTKKPIRIEKVGLNPTRTHFLELLEKKGLKVNREDVTTKNNEILGTLIIDPSGFCLDYFNLEHKDVVKMIDEIPLVVMLASRAQKPSKICGCDELKVKESNRLKAITEIIDGASYKGDDIVIIPSELQEKKVDTYGDHRIEMLIKISNLIVNGEITFENESAINISSTSFGNNLKKFML